MNAAVKLIHRLRHYDHVTPLLRDLHWLNSPERVDFNFSRHRLQVSPWSGIECLVGTIQRIADTGRRHLRSSSTKTLIVPYTAGLLLLLIRVFSSSCNRLRNSLQHDATVASILSTFLYLNTMLRTRYPVNPKVGLAPRRRTP